MGTNAPAPHNGNSISEMNVVPLIDILLVLLIIFMVIAPSIPRGLETVIPQPGPVSTAALPPDTSVVVQVAKNGKLKINSEEANWDTLGPRVEQIFKDRADKVAFVKGDSNVLFMDVARAIDIMRGSGIDKVGLITEQIKDGSARAKVLNAPPSA
ncbi:MAG: biopolymer transporter ExbD [Acidobacteriota bacterium]|nr:biopolymer transporter ExbD [Acidobacteriota bacterium]